MAVAVCMAMSMPMLPASVFSAACTATIGEASMRG